MKKILAILATLFLASNLFAYKIISETPVGPSPENGKDKGIVYELDFNEFGYLSDRMYVFIQEKVSEKAFGLEKNIFLDLKEFKSVHDFVEYFKFEKSTKKYTNWETKSTEYSIVQKYFSIWVAQKLVYANNVYTLYVYADES